MMMAMMMIMWSVSVTDCKSVSVLPMSTRWELDSVGVDDGFLSAAPCGVLRVVVHQCVALTVKERHGKTSESKLSGV